VGPLASDCLVRNTWVCPKYVQTRSSDLTAALTQHVELTTVSVLIGLAVALPLAVVARRLRLSSLLLGTATVVYTVPSLALFSLLVPFTGLTSTTVVIGLVLYSLTILLRNVLAGLDGVSADVREAARGMGFGPFRMLLQVELPLAFPTIMAGLRVATVSTVALTTIGFLVGSGGLGNLIQDGLQSNFKAEVLTASVLCVLLAVAADLVLLVVQRALTPWARSQS
jgi:osmoprotectant transport system permease protein